MFQTATNCELAGRYRLCRWLAAGGMGQVWQAVDQVLDRPVAVKLLHDENAQDRSFISRFRVEAQHAAAVPHPGIASVFDYGEAPTAAGAEPTAFLVMEIPTSCSKCHCTHFSMRGYSYAVFYVYLSKRHVADRR